MIAEFFRKLLGLTTDAEDFEAGAKYVRDQVKFHGADNKYEMDRLWCECDGAFDHDHFDKGMARTLSDLNIPDPQDPRWCH